MQRIHHHLHAGVVDDQFLVLNFRELRGHGADRAEEQAVRELHDVGFVDGMNFFAAVTASVIEGKAGNARGSPFGNDFQAFHNSGDHFVLEARVQVLGVFAHQDQIHIFEMGFYAWEVLHGPQIGVKVERFSQRHIDARRTTCNRGGHGALQGDAVATDGIDGRLIDALSLVGGLIGAAGDYFPLDLHTRGFQNAACGGGHFRADAFTGNKRNWMLHGRISL